MLHSGPAARRIEALWQVPLSPTPLIFTLIHFSSSGVRGPVDPRSSFCEGYEPLFVPSQSHRMRNLDLDRFELASQGDSCVRNSINITDYTAQLSNMNDQVELNPCNNFLITPCHFCVTPKYSPGGGIWNERGQKIEELRDNSLFICSVGSCDWW